MLDARCPGDEVRRVEARDAGQEGAAERRPGVCTDGSGTARPASRSHPFPSHGLLIRGAGALQLGKPKLRGLAWRPQARVCATRPQSLHRDAQEGNHSANRKQRASPRTDGRGCYCRASVTLDEQLPAAPFLGPVLSPRLCRVLLPLSSLPLWSRML